MYKIFADDTLIYDSTLDDYKIGKGSITLETNKSGSFTFSIYPDHFYYERFIRLRTIITVYKSGKIVFRGRILNDVSDYWNNKVITCEGELSFLQDSIVRPFDFTGTPEELFRQFIEEHNSQADEFKRFNIGEITVVDPNNYITRSETEYESTISNINEKLVESSLGGYLYITHGEDGTEDIPTLNYLSDFTKVSSQTIEFGSNLKSYTKTVKADSIATVIIPLGAEVEDGVRLTIEDVNDGKDYVCNDEAVALYGHITKVVTWDDVAIASNLKQKAEEYLETSINQNITIELNAIDLHLLDHSIESFKVGDYIRVISSPHNFNSVLLCNKQTLDLLKPENDAVTLGRTYSAFTESNDKLQNNVKRLSNVCATKTEVSDKVKNTIIETEKFIGETTDGILQEISKTYTTKSELTEEVKALSASISITEVSILQQVSGSYATKSELENTVTELNSSISMSESAILQQVSGSYATKSELRSVSAEIALTIKTDKDGNLASAINIKSNLLTIDTDYFKLGETGEITSTGGTIAGFTIEPTQLKYDNGDYLICLATGTGENALFPKLSLGKSRNRDGDYDYRKISIDSTTITMFKSKDDGKFNGNWFHLYGETAIYSLYLDFDTNTVKFKTM